jgi:proline iminopeptidase
MRALIYLLFSSSIIFSLPALSQEYQYLETDDFQLAYRVFGEGPPLLLLNGGPGFPSTHFSYLAEKLSQERQVILFDQRGTGKSTLSSIDTSTIKVALMINDIEALRRHLSIESWMVMGHSWGGMYAMCYATQYPERVDKLLLSASGGIDLSFLEGLGAAIRSKLNPEELADFEYYTAHPNAPNAREKRLQAMAPAYVYHRKHVPTVVKYLGELSAFVPEVNRLVWTDLRAIHYNLAQKAQDFKKPVLIIQGKQDILMEETALKIDQAFPNSELALIDQCSHYLWLDQPQQYFRALQEFIVR